MARLIRIGMSSLHSSGHDRQPWQPGSGTNAARSRSWRFACVAVWFVAALLLSPSPGHSSPVLRLVNCPQGGQCQTWNDWIRGSTATEDSASQARFRPVFFEVSGSDRQKRSKVEYSATVQSPWQYRVAIAPNDMARERRSIETCIDCLRHFPEERSPLDGASITKIRWFFNGKRIHRPNASVRYSPSMGHKRGALVLVAAPRGYGAELEGSYRCEIRDINRILLLTKTYQVKYFHEERISHSFVHSPVSNSEVLQRAEMTVAGLLRHRPTCPQKATLTVREVGLTWAMLQWTLSGATCTGSVTTLLLREGGWLKAIGNPAQQGAVNMTNLLPNTRHKIRVKTSNRPLGLSSSVSFFFFSTDAPAQIQCSTLRVIVRVNGSAHTSCTVLGRPVPRISTDDQSAMARLSTAQALHRTVLSIRWQETSLLKVICVMAENRHGRDETCIRTSSLCPAPTSPTHGLVVVSNASNPTDVADFTCGAGYTLHGLKRLKCVAQTGEWDGQPPLCVPS